MARCENILITDDEAGIRNLLFEVLSGKGFQVTLASDGRDSLSKMQDHRFDLLITDINMPKLDGIGLLREMKKAGRKEKVIVMSGKALGQLAQEKDVPPVFTTLEKPFRLHKFLDAVTSALAQPQTLGKGATAGDEDGGGGNGSRCSIN